MFEESIPEWDGNLKWQRMVRLLQSAAGVNSINFGEYHKHDIDIFSDTCNIICLYRIHITSYSVFYHLFPVIRGELCNTPPGPTLVRCNHRHTDVTCVYIIYC